MSCAKEVGGVKLKIPHNLWRGGVKCSVHTGISTLTQTQCSASKREEGGTKENKMRRGDMG